MTLVATALDGLDHALDAPHDEGLALGSWRWSVRQRMAGVRDLLVAETAPERNAWLAARSCAVLRERNVLLGRLSDLGPRVLECSPVEDVRQELKRLLIDVQHHVQRLHDLAYDDVELELGGSD